jgi:hypothetical protein
MRKNQGSDEGALRIPDCASQQAYFKKRFPHRFLPSSGALTLVAFRVPVAASDFIEV